MNEVLYLSHIEMIFYCIFKPQAYALTRLFVQPANCWELLFVSIKLWGEAHYEQPANCGCALQSFFFQYNVLLLCYMKDAI